MSLSKYFKNSDSFQPQKIVKSTTKTDSGWKSLANKKDPSSFQAEQQLKRTKSPTDLAKDPDTEQSQENSDLYPSSLDTLQKHGGDELNTPDQSPNSSKYIAISEIETQLKQAYDDGVQNGLEKAEEDYGSATRSLVTSCQQLNTVRETIISNSSRELQEFAFAIAERIIRKSLRDNDTIIVATIEEALQRAVKSDEFYIYIHPDDYDIVVEKSDDLITGLSGLNNLVIKKDITVERGGAKIESDNCTIDATIAGQFDVILEEMKKKL